MKHTYTENGKWGYKDEETNEILIPAKYDDVDIFNENTFGVKKNDKWQIVDRKNIPKNSQFYDAIEKLFPSNILAVLQDDKWGFVYTNGQAASSLRVDEFVWKDPFLQIKINDKWGVLNWKLEEILPVEYDKIEIEDLGLQEYEVSETLGVVDKAGTIIIPSSYDIIAICSDFEKKIVGKKEGADDFVYTTNQYIHVASRQWKWGVFDIFGNEKIPTIYDELSLSYKYDDLFPACLNGKWGYINIENEVIIPFVYDGAEEFFYNDFAKVTMGDKQGLIDRKGNII